MTSPNSPLDRLDSVYAKGMAETNFSQQFSHIIILGQPYPRLRVRRLDEKALAEEVSRQAVQTQQWQFVCRHGGQTAYHHAADTEAALAVSNPIGWVVVWMARLPASRVTLSGAAEMCLPGSRPYFDPRYSDVSKRVARKLMQVAYRKHFPKTYHERLLSDDVF